MNKPDFRTRCTISTIRDRWSHSWVWLLTCPGTCFGKEKSRAEFHRYPRPPCSCPISCSLLVKMSMNSTFFFLIWQFGKISFGKYFLPFLIFTTLNYDGLIRPIYCTFLTWLASQSHSKKRFSTSISLIIKRESNTLLLLYFLYDASSPVLEIK